MTSNSSLPLQPEESTPTAAQPERSKALPAEHPSAPIKRVSLSRPRQSSLEADGVSPRTVIHAQQSSDPTLPLDNRRGKSVSLSIPVVPNHGYDHKRAASQAQVLNALNAPTIQSKSANNLKISIPPSSDMHFLTALASQERQVLELKEQLSKAEDELVRLKRLWVSQESKKRQSEARGVHRMTSTPTSARSARFSIAGPPSVEIMYEEMQRRKASIHESSNTSSIERPPRRRLFSGSRQLRNLSLVTPPPISETAEDHEAKQSSESSETLVNSPTQMPPTPDLIEEEDDDPSTASTRSSRSPHRERALRSSLRTSMQMATEFREGLWTFFEDLKQATVGEDARSPDALPAPEKAPMSPPPARKDNSRTDSSPPSSKNQAKKQTVRRQTWQFRPSEVSSDPPVLDTTTFWQDQGIAEGDENEPADQLPRRPIGENGTSRPSKSKSNVELHNDGQAWQSWDSNASRGTSPAPSRSSSTTPVPPHSERRSTNKDPTKTVKLTRNDSDLRRGAAATVSKTSAQPAQEHFRRDSMAWPVLEKLKPGHLRQGVNNLLDDWERSLMPPGQQSRVGHGPLIDPTVVPTSRPVTHRSNSRLDDMYQ